MNTDDFLYRARTDYQEYCCDCMQVSIPETRKGPCPGHLDHPHRWAPFPHNRQSTKPMPHCYQTKDALCMAPWLSVDQHQPMHCRCPCAACTIDRNRIIKEMSPK